MTIEVIDNIGDDLRAAMAAQTDAPAPDVQADDVIADVKAAVEAPAETATETAARERDEKGRFAAKQAEQPVAAKTDATQETPAANAQAEQFSAPPRTWKPEQKAAFLELPAHLRQAILDNHAEIEKQTTEFQPKAQRLEQFDKLLEPWRDTFTMRGISEVQAVGALLAAQRMLETDPVNGIVQLMRSYGVTPAHLTGQQVHQPAQDQQGQRPANDPLVRQVQSLTQYIQQQESQREQAANKAIQDEIDSFSRDPKNVYFDNVKKEMGVLINSGAATDLASAYRMACWGRDDIRPLMLKADASERAKAEQAAAAQKVAAAKQAAGSVIGSPGPGAAVRNSNPRNSVKDDLMEALNEHMGA